MLYVTRACRFALILSVSLGMLPFGVCATATEDVTPETAQTPAAVSLADQVEIVINGGLRSSRVTEHLLIVSIKNLTDEEIAGPLGLTIDDTGLSTLQVVASQEQGEVENYFEILPETARLRPGQTSRPIRLTFHSPQALTLADRAQFQLSARVVRPGEVDLREVAAASQAELVPGKEYTWDRMYEVFSIQQKWTPFLMEHDGVVGTATSEDDAGNLVLRVYTTRHGVIKDLPGELDGLTLQQTVVGGHFVARPGLGGVIYPDGQAISPTTRQRRNHGLGRHILLPLPVGTDDPQTATIDMVDGGVVTPDETTDALGPRTGNTQLELPPLVPGPVRPGSQEFAGPGGNPTQRFNRPVPIGVSIFNINDVCASGTMGCRCVDAAGNVYGLTNNHVGAATNLGVIGDPIVQPGLGDHIPPCEQDPFDIMGFLADFVTISDVTINVMDCALIDTDPTLLAGCTPDDGYGFPSSRVLASPYIGLEVQKSGRTTLYTRGRVTALNVSAPVNYGFLAQFESCIEIRNDVSDFGLPGDSGSLIVTFPDRRPVAILFGGGGGATLGNPINPILERFNVIIDDGSLTPASPIFPISGRMGIATGAAPAPDAPVPQNPILRTP